jgi:hypothetical protein
LAVASTLPPNNVYTSGTLLGLGPGQSALVNLNATLSNTGCYSVVIVADLNNEVNEGAGEGNNFFTLNYCVNKPIVRQATQILNPGDTIDLEGNAIQGDLNWNTNALQLDALFNARIGIIPTVTLDTVHYDLINPNTVNQITISRSSLLPGTILGVLTADGNRGAVRIDGLPGNQLQVTFILYQN